MYEITDEASLRYAIKDYIRFYAEERPQDRYQCTGGISESHPNTLCSIRVVDYHFILLD